MKHEIVQKLHKNFNDYAHINHFADAGKVVLTGSGAKREIDDIALTRYACYLIAQNSDPRKEEVAFAMAYFAIQTRKQELVEKRIEEKDTRDLLVKRGIVPENLPLEEDLKKVQRRLKSEDKKFLKGNNKK